MSEVSQLVAKKEKCWEPAHPTVQVKTTHLYAKIGLRFEGEIVL